MVSLRLTIALLLALFTALAHGEISARLSSNSIEELESVRLVIRAHNTRESESLNLAGLQENFHIMGNNTSTQYQYINGRAQSWVDYQITLQPKKVGALTIPPIRIGNLATKTLILEVRPLAASTRQQIDELVFYQQQFSSSKAYVQSQILMQRQLFYSNGVQLYGGQPGAPNIENAAVITLGENQATTVQRNGRTYGVVTQNYAIFPEASGALTIPAVEMTASVRMLNNGRVSRKGVRVATELKTIMVMPIPNNYPKNSPWLPATDVLLSQAFEPKLMQNTVDVGDTLTQVVKITVESNTGSIVPPLSSALPENTFREYPEPAELIDSTQGINVVGQRIERRNLMPLTPGTLTLPSIEVVWWDTNTNEVKRSTLDATSFKAQGESINQRTTAAEESAQGNTSLFAGGEKTSEQPAVEELDIEIPIAASQRLQWAFAAIAFVIGLIAVFQAFKRTLTNQSWALRRARKTLLHRIEAADAQGIQQSLRQYLQVRYALLPDKALETWISEQPEARRFVRLLALWRYSEEPATDVPEDLMKLAQQLFHSQAAAPNKANSGMSLPALYPSI